MQKDIIMGKKRVTYEENSTEMHRTAKQLNKKCLYLEVQRVQPTLQATLWGQSLPKPRGGDIFLNKVTTSKCFMRPLQNRRKQNLLLVMTLQV